jgi:hypothetical protein
VVRFVVDGGGAAWLSLSVAAPGWKLCEINRTRSVAISGNGQHLVGCDNRHSPMYGTLRHSWMACPPSASRRTVG